jgi:hypothetical protein
MGLRTNFLSGKAAFCCARGGDILGACGGRSALGKPGNVPSAVPLFPPFPFPSVNGIDPTGRDPLLEFALIYSFEVQRIIPVAIAIAGTTCALLRYTDFVLPARVVPKQ